MFAPAARFIAVPLTLFVFLLALAAFLVAPAQAAPLLPERSAAAATGVFGMTLRGKPRPLPANMKRVSPYRLHESGAVTHLSAYLDGKGRGRGRSQSLRLVLYDDEGGAPKALIASTTNYRVKKGAAGLWVSLPLTSPVELAPGRYYLGIHSGGKARVARYGAVRGKATLRKNRNRFRAGPTRVFGRADTSSARIAINGQYKKDRKPPSMPRNLAVTEAGASSLTIAWSASTDNVAVQGYRVDKNGVRLGFTTKLTHSFAGLSCGTTYTFGVDAVDLSANVSRRASISAATSACSSPPPAPPSPPPPPPSDTMPPSVPQGMTFSSRTQTTVSLVWLAATDDVGVAGYRLYRDNVHVGTTQDLAYSFTGLACGTSYTFALEAYDAAGNASNRAEATGSTSTLACDAPPQPPAPPPPPSPPPSGEPTPTVFVAPSGSDASSCTAAAPCASFQRAYERAAPGAVVEVAGGTYPGQRFLAVAGKSAPNVIFRPATGARVVLGGLNFGTDVRSQAAKYITVRDMELTYADPDHQRGIWVGVGSGQIRLERMDAGNISTWLADGVAVIGGDFGPCRAPASGCWLNNIDVSDNVLIDGAVFHDYNYLPSCLQSGDCHWRAIYINGGRNITLRNSTVRDSVFAPWTTISGSEAAVRGNENILIENNQFGRPVQSPITSGWQNAWCQNGSQPSYRGITIRFNSFARGSEADFPGWYNAEFGCRVQNYRVYGNVFGGRPVCPSEQTQIVGVSYQYNVYAGSKSGTCGPGDVNIGGTTMPFYATDTTAPQPRDYQVVLGFAGDSLVPLSAGCPATDAAGRPRGINGFCTAGAFER